MIKREEEAEKEMRRKKENKRIYKDIDTRWKKEQHEENDEEKKK